MVGSIYRSILEEANAQGKSREEQVNVFCNECLKISLKAFNYFAMNKVDVQYAIGYVYHKNNCFFECDYKSIIQNMTKFDTDMKFHVHAWLVVERSILIDFTLLPTTEGRLGAIILRGKKIDQPQYMPVFLTTSPFDLLMKLGFYIAK